MKIKWRSCRDFLRVLMLIEVAEFVFMFLIRKKDFMITKDTHISMYRMRIWALFRGIIVRRMLVLHVVWFAISTSGLNTSLNMNQTSYISLIKVKQPFQVLKRLKASPNLQKFFCVYPLKAFLLRVPCLLPQQEMTCRRFITECYSTDYVPATLRTEAHGWNFRWVQILESYMCHSVQKVLSFYESYQPKIFAATMPHIRIRRY